MSNNGNLFVVSSLLVGCLSGCVEDDLGREIYEDERASSCGAGGIVEPTALVNCANDDVIEQYVYTKNDAGRTIRLKRFACSDAQQVTPWHSFEDAPGNPVSDSVLGAASLHRDGSMLDYVLSSNGNIYFRERDPLIGPKAEWRVVANTSDFPGDPGTPTQMAMYDDVDGRSVISVGFSNFSLFRGIHRDNPHITNGGLGGLGLPVTHLDDMSDSDWLEAFASERWVKVPNSAVPGGGSQIAHSTYVGYIGGAKALIQGIWKSSGDTWFRWDSGGTGEGFDAATWYCNSLDALAQSWPADVREQVPTATDSVPLELTLAAEAWLSEGAREVETPFACAEQYAVTQGNDTALSHNGKEQYAFDFGMSVGTSILAVRGGTVKYLREDSDVGGCDASYQHDSNYIVIEHGDGTSSMFNHLGKDSSPVQIGDRVEAGDVIGAVGETGWSCGAHLHMQIQLDDGCDGWYCQSIPASFPGSGTPVAGSVVHSSQCG